MYKVCAHTLFVLASAVSLSVWISAASTFSPHTVVLSLFLSAGLRGRRNDPQALGRPTTLWVSEWPALGLVQITVQNSLSLCLALCTSRTYAASPSFHPSAVPRHREETEKQRETEKARERERDRKKVCESRTTSSWTGPSANRMGLTDEEANG